MAKREFVSALKPKPKLVIIVGPTAAGKSELALELAERLNGEIINADSQQVYRYMDIGTDKPSAADRARVRHHLIDIVAPDEEFNAALFREHATAAVEDIHRRGKQVFVCGGTGLYLKALTRGLFAGPPRDAILRRRLNAEAERAGPEALYRRLENIDAEAVRRIHPNDRQRIIRALEVFEITGKPMSAWQKEHAFGEAPFDSLTIGVERERAELYRAIDERCDRMLADGLLDEVKGLAARGYSLDLKPLQSIGYRHMGAVLTGTLTLEDAAALMKRDTRRLAKQQMTWFRGERAIHWFRPEARAEIRAAVEGFWDDRQ